MRFPDYEGTHQDLGLTAADTEVEVLRQRCRGMQRSRGHAFDVAGSRQSWLYEVRPVTLVWAASTSPVGVDGWCRQWPGSRDRSC